MEDTGLAGAVIPRHPGVLSAFGCLIADIRHDLVETVNLDTARVDAGDLYRRLRSAEKRLVRFLAETGLALADLSVRREFDMAYEHQTHTITVDASALTDLSPEAIQDAFDRAYAASYGRTLEGVATRLLSIRTAVIGRRRRIDPRVFAARSPTTEAGPPASRPVYIDGRWLDTPVSSRLDLPVGAVIAGPAILEQSDATIVVEPGFTGRVDEFGNLFLEAAHP